MSVCAFCGLDVSGDAALCMHHHDLYGDDWGAQNRIICDFIHRGRAPPRLPAGQRDDDMGWREMHD
jgi:hypothetical protein